MPCRDIDEPTVAAWMIRFGLAVRGARHQAGLSQERLGARGALPRSLVSRLEHGLLRYTTLSRVARLSIGMNGQIPIGPCPHGHACPWSEPLIMEREFNACHRRLQAMRMGIVDPRQLAMLDGSELGPEPTSGGTW